jgi:hypothetical protein
MLLRSPGHPPVRGTDEPGSPSTGFQLPGIPAWREFTQDDLDRWMAAAEGTVPPEQPRPSDT